MVFVRQHVSRASQAGTQQGLCGVYSRVTDLLNFISTLLLVHTAVKWISATQEQISMLTGQGVNERTLEFSAEPDKGQVDVGSYKGER